MAPDFEIGYALSSEEHPPNAMVRFAQRAEDVGFSFLGISDHFHPWVDSQGHSPFVWSVIGGIAAATERIKLGTGVTCPMIRIHPVIIAQAAATSACMMPGRFFLGVGSGEKLNEHILGDRWPPTDVRHEMLEEAVEVIRLLWQGGTRSHEGKHYRVENARIYTLPEELPPIIVAAAGPKAVDLAARTGDGFWGVSPQQELLEQFERAGGTGPKYGQVTVCWAADEDEAKKTAYEIWPNAGIKGELSQELPTPTHFEQAAQMVRPDDLAESVPLGPDPERHLASIRQYLDAGYDRVYVHQIGPDQEGFFDFYQREVLPKLK
ncbi:MAG: TIGR03557 family F420-dependent LLM class oxidoreductase [Actinomycetota bacterium]|nr:TIGR03557 family F420-dependent LLM class oxidoreductase [Actinomycetota bacterium]